MPEHHGIDFHPDFQKTDLVKWNLVPHYPLMAVKMTESVHVGYWESDAARDFLIMRKRKEEGKHRYVMGYHWITSRERVIDQVNNFQRFIKRYIGAFEQGESYQLDYETTPYAPLPPQEECTEFMNRFQDLYGVEGILYCSDWMPDSPEDSDTRGEFYEWREANPNLPLWYANYAYTSTGPTGGQAEVARYRADVWQWDHAQKVPGFLPTVNVDMNQIMTKGWATLDRICRIPQPKPTPTPKPTQPLPPPPTGEDGTMNVIVVPRGCAARFLGTSDGKGFISSMTWISSEEKRARLPYPEQVVDVSDCRNIGLIGPVPQGDPGHAWTLSDFLNFDGS